MHSILNSIRRTLALAFPILALLSSHLLADKNADIMAGPEFQRIGGLLQKADAAEDYWNAYRYALEVNEMVPNPLFLSFAVKAMYHTIDFGRAETTPNAGISDKWVMRIAQCPEPGRDSDASTHVQYFMTQTCLACYVGNLEHDFNAALLLAAKARRHLNLTRQKDPALYDSVRKSCNPEAMIEKIEKTARSNKRIETAGKVATWIRKAMTQPGADSDRTITESTAAPSKNTKASSGEKSKPLGQPQFEHYAGTSQLFKVSSLGAMGGSKNMPLSAAGGWVTVYDARQDRKLSFNYGEVLGTKVGDSVTVNFDADGRPATLKNNRTGKAASIHEAY